jgi:glycerol-3-phosphate O-acyltransferase / dihydroxyacetone phosphate acyltransferase
VIRRGIDRLFGLIALALARGFHRTFAVVELGAARRRGPAVVVVNHFNGFMDVVVVVAALGRLPRFVGKATLGDVLVARPFLRLAGVVLVQRTVDGAGTGANASAFARCHDRLRRGETVVIFPEGTTHDRESLAPIRTGAARIALGAATAGVPDVAVVPVGLTFGDKTRLRNDVVVAGGPPIPVGGGGEDDHVAVRELTTRITEGLEALVAGVDDPVDAWVLERAAAVAARHPGREPELADVRATARRLARAPGPAREAVEQAVSDYTLALDVAGVDDAAVSRSDPPSIVGLVVRALATWVAAPAIASVAVLNAPAVAAVALVDRFVTTPVTKGTVRALLAVVLLPATWITVAVLATDGALRITALVVVHAVSLLLLLWLLETNVEVLQRWWRHHRARVAAARLPALQVRRARVVDAVEAALGR